MLGFEGVAGFVAPSLEAGYLNITTSTLQSLGLPGLVDVDQLVIQDSPNLSMLDVGNLETLEKLMIVKNTNLKTLSFPKLNNVTFEGIGVQLSGNFEG
jgi:hypothetical protein